MQTRTGLWSADRAGSRRSPCSSACLQEETQTGPHMPPPIVKSLQNNFPVLEIFYHRVNSPRKFVYPFSFITLYRFTSFPSPVRKFCDKILNTPSVTHLFVSVLHRDLASLASVSKRIQHFTPNYNVSGEISHTYTIFNILWQVLVASHRMWRSLATRAVLHTCPHTLEASAQRLHID